MHNIRTIGAGLRNNHLILSRRAAEARTPHRRLCTVALVPGCSPSTSGMWPCAQVRSTSEPRHSAAPSKCRRGDMSPGMQALVQQSQVLLDALERALGHTFGQSWGSRAIARERGRARRRELPRRQLGVLVGRMRHGTRYGESIRHGVRARYGADDRRGD